LDGHRIAFAALDEGISLPGMPEGSPGMTGHKSEPFRIYEISDEAKVFAVE
jgi:hypothetical protein